MPWHLFAIVLCKVSGIKLISWKKNEIKGELDLCLEIYWLKDKLNQVSSTDLVAVPLISVSVVVAAFSSIPELVAVVCGRIIVPHSSCDCSPNRNCSTFSRIWRWWAVIIKPTAERRSNQQRENQNFQSQHFSVNWSWVYSNSFILWRGVVWSSSWPFWTVSPK
jgi:hypothetical protein